MSQWQQWWAGRQPRERWLLGIAGVLAVFLLLYAALYLPLQRHRQALAEQVQQGELDLLQARRLAELIRSRGPAAATSLPGPDRSLLARVDEGLREAGLSTVLSRIEPEGDRRVRLWLDAAPFDGLIAWLERVASEQGVRLIDASIDREIAPGLVSVRLTLEQGA